MMLDLLLHLMKNDLIIFKIFLNLTIFYVNLTALGEGGGTNLKKKKREFDLKVYLEK